MLEHSRAIGDTLSLLRVKLQQDGEPVDLTGIGMAVKFYMVSEAGTVIINNAAATIVDADDGIVSYDFSAGEVANAGIFYGVFRVRDTNTNEEDTYPAEDNPIKITIYDPAENRETASPSIDILTLANAPIRTRTVEGTVEERSVNELVKADQYAASKTATVGGQPWGIRVARTRPGGMNT